MSEEYLTDMSGFYDRQKNHEGIKLFLRGIFKTREERRVWREYCVQNGYGSMQTMLEILPDEGINL